MPQYRYQARVATGRTQSGVLSAQDASTAASMLRSQGHHVLQLAPAAGNKADVGSFLKQLNYSSGPSQKDILDFTTQLAVMIRAGISIRNALDGIAEQVQNQKFRKILIQIKPDIESGKKFSEDRLASCRSVPCVNMVRASRCRGRSRACHRIAAYLSQEIETRRMVVGASIYPGVIATMAIGVTVFLLTFVLPKFAMVFKGKEAALPAPTKFLMSLSNFMVDYWWVLLAGLATSIVAFLAFIRTELGGFWWDKFKLNSPIIKRMFRALYISRSLHTMGELLNAGVPMLDTLSITGDISGNRLYKRSGARVRLREAGQEDPGDAQSFEPPAEVRIR